MKITKDLAKQLTISDMANQSPAPTVTEEWISQMAASLVPVIGTLAERRVKSCLEITALHSTLCGEIKKLMLQDGVKVKEGK